MLAAAAEPHGTGEGMQERWMGRHSKGVSVAGEDRERDKTRLTRLGGRIRAPPRMAEPPLPVIIVRRRL